MDGFEILNSILDESVEEALYETKRGFFKIDERANDSASTGQYRNEGKAQQGQNQDQNYPYYTQDYDRHNETQNVNNDYYYQNNENVNKQNMNNQYNSQNYENQNQTQNQNNAKPNKYPVFNHQYYSPNVEQDDDDKNVRNPYYYRRAQQQNDNQDSKRAQNYEKTENYPFYKPAESSAKQAIYNTSQQDYETQQRAVENSEKPSVKEVAHPKLVSRNLWGALMPMGNINPMKAPAEMTVFSINTGTPACYNEKDCRRTVKEIQARHLGEGLADIQYNFLVGGDGNVYEGRGWHLESGVQANPDEGPNYNIAFIGRYPDGDAIPKEMLYPVKDLMNFARSKNLVIGEKNRKDFGKKI